MLPADEVGVHEQAEREGEQGGGHLGALDEQLAVYLVGERAAE